MAVTLAQLRTRARTRADMTSSPFVSDAELDEFINSAWSELYDLMIGVFEDYFLTSTTITLLTGVQDYSLAAVSPLVYKLRGCDLLISNQPNNFVPLPTFEWTERGMYVGIGAGVGTYLVNGETFRYAYRGSNIRFAPVPDTTNNVTVWYIPVLSLLGDGTGGTITELPGEVKPGWEEYVVLEAAIQCLLKEESDVSMLMARKDRLTKRIEAMAPNRDAESPHRMTRRDVRDDDEWGWW